MVPNNHKNLESFDDNSILPLDQELAKEQGVDHISCFGGKSDSPNARCALWWTGTPSLEGKKTGYIGQFTAIDKGSASGLLERSCQILAEHGADLAIGPIDGNTWRNHRLVVEGSDRLPFFMEPRNPVDWPQYFIENHFHIIANYSSSTVDLSVPLENSSTFDKTRHRLIEKNKILIRQIDTNRFEEELRKIFIMARESFHQNFLYQPITETEFIATYRKIEPVLDPEFVRIAEFEGQIVGFIFAVQDMEGIDLSGKKRPAIIIKTLAAQRGYHFAGLGSLLVREVHEHALELGHSEVIHALQYEHNTSLKINARCGAKTFRRYALFARKLKS